MSYQIDLETLDLTIDSLLEGNHYLSNLSNLSALLNEVLTDINWVGFYLNIDSKLVLGPFQGKVACTTINYDKGVLGHCYNLKESVIVENVHEFPGHIACDSATNSEICIPVFKQDEIFAILDIDSPILNRFSKADLIFLEKIIKKLEKHL